MILNRTSRVTTLSLLVCINVCVLLGVPGASGVGRSKQRPDKNIASLAQVIDQAFDTPELRAGFQGVMILSPQDGVVLYERNADRTFLPASNNKLLTSVAALELLGPNFVYHTRLLRTGAIGTDGTLHGNLILQGAGDPLLSAADLEELAGQAYKAGLRRVEGDLYYDDTLFDQQRLGDTWAWDDETYYYSAQISALNLNENLVTVQAKPGDKPGDPVTFHITPTDQYTTILNTAKTGPAGSRPSLIFDRLRGQNVLTISGALPIDVKPQANPPVGLTVEDPSRFTAFVLSGDLLKAGIRLGPGALVASSGAPKTASLLAEHVSIALSGIVKRMNKPSDNLIAECLLKTVGAVKRGKGTGGEDGTGAQAARDFFQSIGLDMQGLHQADGSGLSRTNFVSPHNLVRLLTYMVKSQNFKVFYDSLPIAGVDGSLANRLKATAAANNCHAKTGYESHVSSLSGYVTTHDGERLVFSILMNNHLAPNSVCVAAQDKIVRFLAEHDFSKPQQD